MKKRHQQKLVVLSVLLFIGLNIPIVLLFSNMTSVFGFPLIYVYIFGIWILSVMVSFIILKRYYE
ncbi:hypothetical protein NAT50_09050 [Flavobacterium sp. HXWNR70]|uniref:DUF3311 domain-containing protein n=1 Tax=Flavobacterium luminosum TaxID=2949086 RepID=A0ABT0TPT7_9FLAO|nr:hypothetical protein [Flavobacterium sp. HXWNR70]MCL9809502.1 hypothetical protein [Flavobacterium sp. HXWNR70]